jgi:hypothetical protein
MVDCMRLEGPVGVGVTFQPEPRDPEDVVWQLLRVLGLEVERAQARKREYRTVGTDVDVFDAPAEMCASVCDGSRASQGAMRKSTAGGLYKYVECARSHTNKQTIIIIIPHVRLSEARRLVDVVMNR